jgi:hypothetical protein
MKTTRVRRDGKPLGNKTDRWFQTLSSEQRTLLFQHSAHAQWGPKQQPKKADDGPWGWPIDLDRYDRSGALTASEEGMLTRYAEAYRVYRYGRTMDFGQTLDRLVKPLNDALTYTGIRTYFRKYVLLFFLREMAERRRSFWGWTADEWIELIDRQKTEYQHVVAVAYLLCGFSDLHRLRKNQIVYVVLARKVFGREYMKVVGDRVQSLLREWGYMKYGTLMLVLRTVFEGLLYKRSPHLHELTVEDLQAVAARRPPRTGSYCIVALSRVLASMGTVPEAMEIKRPVKDKKLSPALTTGVPAEWCRLSRLWHGRASYSIRNRDKSYYFLLNVGRWLGKTHPDLASPADWTRDLVAEAVSVVCQWHGGDCAASIQGM